MYFPAGIIMNCFCVPYLAMTKTRRVVSHCLEGTGMRDLGKGKLRLAHPTHRLTKDSPGPIDLVRIKRPLPPKESIFLPSVFIGGACKIVGQNGTLASLFILFSTDTLTARYYLWNISLRRPILQPTLSVIHVPKPFTFCQHRVLFVWHMPFRREHA